ncbi:hypothetical protein C1889_25525 [Pseudomonas sp. FW507-12TSA]|nr:MULTISPECIES: hypothetical protein [unclassified Pseudomonas]POA51825.1 hypothetical protein C1889_25525 [Pseudomonas sp. FW507-12TSA]
MSCSVQRQVGLQPTYRSCYRTVLYAVDTRYDIRGSMLSEMVKICLTHRATLPPARRAYFAQYAPGEVMADLERFTAKLLFGPMGRLSPQEYRHSCAIDLCKF